MIAITGSWSYIHILSKKRQSLKKTTAFMARFCQKNLHSLKNTMLSCNFFQIFHEKPPSVMPIFGKKNVNSVKTILYSFKITVFSCHLKTKS